MKKAILILLVSFIVQFEVYSQDCENGNPYVSVTVPLSNMESWDALNDSDNYTTDICGFPVNGNMVGMTWADIDLQPYGDSWCSEIAIDIHNVLIFRPGVAEANTAPCNNNYSGGSVSYLQDNNFDFVIDATGCITLEFHETFDDDPNDVDGDILDGSIIFFACPEGFFLPIELNYIFAEAQRESNIVRWSTASESNSDWHIIERSVDGRNNWEEVGRLSGGGTTTDERVYELEDKSPYPVSYYRLKEVAFDGNKEYSNVVVVERESKIFRMNSIAPNPTKGKATMHYEMRKPGPVTLEIFDFLGKIILKESWESEAGLLYKDLNIEQFSAGVYSIVLHNGSLCNNPL